MTAVCDITSDPFADTFGSGRGNGGAEDRERLIAICHVMDNTSALITVKLRGRTDLEYVEFVELEAAKTWQTIPARQVAELDPARCDGFGLFAPSPARFLDRPAMLSLIDWVREELQACGSLPA